MAYGEARSADYTSGLLNHTKNRESWCPQRGCREVSEHNHGGGQRLCSYLRSQFTTRLPSSGLRVICQTKASYGAGTRVAFVTRNIHPEHLEGGGLATHVCR